MYNYNSPTKNHNKSTCSILDDKRTTYSNTKTQPSSPVSYHEHGHIANSTRRKEIIQKIEALFPFLEDVMGRNDSRSKEIIEKLAALRDGLDNIFEEFET